MIPSGSFARRYRWARRIIAFTILGSPTITDDERTAAARWLWWASRGGERVHSPLDLRKELAKRGMSQRELSRRTGAAVRTVTSWCNGERQPSVASAHRIADALGLSRRSVAVRIVSKPKRGKPKSAPQQ